MVGVTKIGRRNANYWIEAVAEGGEDYYTKPGEAPGQWTGELAAELGLEGEVSRDHYTALLAGKNPVTGDVLVSRPEPRTFVDADGRKRRLDPILGYDIRFAAPKSVSLLYAVGSSEVRAAILAAHDYAVGEGVAYLERHACFVQRGKGGAVIEPGSGFVSMAFRHRSSRAGDPALHTHLVTANMTRAASDGRWLSLANPKRQSFLLREAKAAGHVYHAALRAEVTRRLGAEWQAIHNGYADLAGIERPVIEHFSQRRAEIVEAMAERGTTSAAAAEVAAYRTRDAKDYKVDPDTQRSEWEARAAEFDLTADSIDTLLLSAVRREPRPIGAAEVERALGELEAHHSHFDRRDLLCALANQLPEGADAAALDRAVDGLLGSERVIEIHRAAGQIASTYYTTPRLWEMEQRFVGTARAGQKAGAAVVDEATLAAVLQRHSYLSAEQAEMVRRLTTGGERIVAVAALPGSGKTTALAAAREAWRAAGHPVIGVATARSASGELSDAGVPATSITAFLIRTSEMAESGTSLAPGAVIVMDESSTTSTPHAAALAELAEQCGGKLVCIGDPRQIGAVGPGGLYGHLTNVIEPAVLTEIRRQRDPVDRRIVQLAHEGRGSDALDLLRSRERLVIADTLPEALNALVLDWQRSYATGEDAVMIARRNRDVEELNARAREVLINDGALAEGELSVAGLPFSVGDRVLTRVNTPTVSNRERWEISAIDAERQSVELQRIGGEGRTVTLDASYLQERTAAGEPPIQHAYAMTIYATQSKTFDAAYVLLDPGSTREEFVVTVSRNRGPTIAYGVAASELTDPDLGPGTREIEDAAHELRASAERVAGEFAAVELSARKRLDAQPAKELIKRRSELERKLLRHAEPSPRKQRLDAVEQRIAAGKAHIAELSAKREGLAAGSRPDRDELARIESAERLSARQLDRLEGEREGLAVEVSIESRHPVVLTAAERSELALIEDRLRQLRRREVAAERLQPSKMIETTLGARPADPTKAALWNEGVDLIYAYRHSNGIASRSAKPLGPIPADPARRCERRAAEQRLARIQHGLGIERSRSAERTASITR
ncbi:MAG TPA: MobF family relaxase [Solirubrobacterales bacterium]|nr:MobF family relaxase [Solirubrobacterales bacterium]